MSQLTPAMDAALSADTPLVCGLLKITLPSGALRLMDGSGQLVFGGEVYVGRDPVFGSLASVDAIEDGVGDEAPALSFTLLPGSDASAASLAAPEMQGSPVSLWLAAVDRTTGLVIPDPLLLFTGELDQPTLTVDKGVRELEFECVSGFERLFDNDEGIRLADSWHKGVWPGELGLSNVSGISKTIYWGVEAPVSSISYGGGGGGNAGGGRYQPRLARQ